MSKSLQKPAGSQDDGYTDLRRIIDAYCDGSATSDELQQLAKKLNEDPAALSLYVEYVGVHTSLDWHVTSREVQSAFLSDDKSVQNIPPAGKNREDLSRWKFTLISVCAAVLLAFWVTPSNQEQEVAADVQQSSATVTSFSDEARWMVVRTNSRPDAMRKQIFATETVHLTSGHLELEFDNGAEVTLSAPAVLQVIAPDKALAIRGKLTANVPERAIGFAVDTPHAQVVDLGTRFGLEVDDVGQTDLVVFEGEVDIAYGPVESQAKDWKRRVMQLGEAVRVDDQGQAKRIVSITSDRFSSSSDLEFPERGRLISRLVDNIRGNESWNYYEIVYGGMGEDVLAYVDRVAHQWNGIDADGMPAYLFGGDYVKMFNNDKFSHTYELSVSLAEPCMLYILFDDRISPPEWLVEGFEDTGDDIGIDRGPYHHVNGKLVEAPTGVGPGESVEDTLSIWSRRVEEPSVVLLGSTKPPHGFLNMYGIVANVILD